MFNNTKTKAMSELKVGTKVRIKACLDVGVMYDGAFFVADMRRFLGKYTEIKSITSHRIKLKGCGAWSWTPEMFDIIE